MHTPIFKTCLGKLAVNVGYSLNSILLMLYTTHTIFVQLLKAQPSENDYIIYGRFDWLATFIVESQVLPCEFTVVNYIYPGPLFKSLLPLHTCVFSFRITRLQLDNVLS